MLIPAITNNEIRDKAPGTYFAALNKANKEFKEILQHHYIPDLAQSGLIENTFLGFLDYRAKELVQAFRVRTGIGSQSEEFFGRDPEKPVSLTETRLRSYLHDVLKQNGAESYWRELVPSDIQDSVNRKIQEEMKRHPYSQDEFSRDDVRIQFLDIMDYAKIILVNWPLFSGTFGSKGEVEKHFLAFKNYRNPVKHGRALNEVDRRNGEAAVLWLENVIRNADTETVH
jgi:hypothetical protein